MKERASMDVAEGYNERDDERCMEDVSLGNVGGWGDVRYPQVLEPDKQSRSSFFNSCFYVS